MNQRNFLAISQVLSKTLSRLVTLFWEQHALNFSLLVPFSDHWKNCDQKNYEKSHSHRSFSSLSSLLKIRFCFDPILAEFWARGVMLATNLTRWFFCPGTRNSFANPTGHLDIGCWSGHKCNQLEIGVFRSLQPSLQFVSCFVAGRTELTKFS